MNDLKKKRFKQRKLQGDSTMTFRKISLMFLGVAFALGLGAGSVKAEYPEKPITLILPLGAGGSHDRNARVFTSVIPAFLGNAIIVKLMPGASGQVGTAAAAKAKPDGYTLLFTHNYYDQLQQHVKKLPYNTTKDFVTVAQLNSGNFSVIVKSSSPFKKWGPGQFRQSQSRQAEIRPQRQLGRHPYPSDAVVQRVGHRRQDHHGAL